MSGARATAALLVLGWLMLGVGLLADVRRGSPEPVIRQFLANLEEQRLEAALAQLTPEAAARYREFLAVQQHNDYEVVSVAIRSPSLLDALFGGRAWRPDQATLVADVREPSGVQWRGSTLVPLAYEDQRWLLQRPPFATE